MEVDSLEQDKTLRDSWKKKEKKKEKERKKERKRKETRGGQQCQPSDRHRPRGIG
jgi:hypothetical protein